MSETALLFFLFPEEVSMLKCYESTFPPTTYTPDEQQSTLLEGKSVKCWQNEDSSHSQNFRALGTGAHWKKKTWQLTCLAALSLNFIPRGKGKKRMKFRLGRASIDRLWKTLATASFSVWYFIQRDSGSNLQKVPVHSLYRHWLLPNTFPRGDRRGLSLEGRWEGD